MLSNAASPPAICDSDSDRVARTLDPRLFKTEQGDLLLLPRSLSANELSVLRRGEHFGAQSFSIPSCRWSSMSACQPPRQGSHGVGALLGRPEWPCACACSLATSAMCKESCRLLSSSLRNRCSSNTASHEAARSALAFPAKA